MWNVICVRLVKLFLNAGSVNQVDVIYVIPGCYESCKGQDSWDQEVEFCIFVNEIGFYLILLYYAGNVAAVTFIYYINIMHVVNMYLCIFSILLRNVDELRNLGGSSL